MNLSFSVTEVLNESFQREHREIVMRKLQEGENIMSQSAFFEMIFNFWVEQNGWAKVEAHKAVERLNKEMEELNKKETLWIILI